MLVIVGASTRAAALSALRAGFEPVCADLFADVDLRSVAAVARIAAGDYPRALAAAAERAPPGPWMYTGSLENHPRLVARIARQRPLWGNAAPTLHAVRDPLAVAEALGRAGLPAPAVRNDPRGLKRDGSWLVKPLASGGGRGIVPLEHDQELAAARSCYFQQRVPGPSFAAVFVASQAASTTTLVGVTRQVVGRPGFPFAYAGSLGPWPLAVGVRERIERVGQTLAAAFGLVGLFGVDLILRDGTPWPVEVNPRYTASVEVLELSLGRALLADHARACDPAADVAPLMLMPQALPQPRLVGKLIVFAPTRCRFPGAPEPAPASADPFALRAIADIPDPGARFEPGEPVLTVFAQGSTINDCRLRLRRRRAYWLRRLRVSS